MMTDRDLNEWDAEIEAEFQRVVAADRKAARRQRDRRHVGFPWSFFVNACRLTRGRIALIVVLYIYRRTKVCGSLTVTLPGGELTELGIDRYRKREALAELEDVGLIRLGRGRAGRSTKVTLAWPPN